MKDKDKTKKNGFFVRLVEKLDKKMEKSAKSKPCCSSKSKSRGGSCCSG